MKIKKHAVACIIIFIMSVCLSGCSKSGAISTYTITLSQMPENLDAQVATSHSEILVLTNIFDGLFDFVDGKPQPNLAKSCTVSPDGLTYTFELKKGEKFYKSSTQQTEVTAKDFAFAFSRILDPKTHSPYFAQFSNIESTQTPDDYILVVKLKKADANFLDKLCLTAATPCNQEFFNSTKGAYGLGVKNVLSNGPFKINYLADDGSYATLIRVKEDKGKLERIRISRLDQEENEENLYAQEKISGFFATEGDYTDSAKQEFVSSQLSMVFNSQNSLFSSAQIRGALAYYAYAMENSGANLSVIEQAKTLFADTVTYDGQPVNDIITPNAPSYMSWDNPKAQLIAGLENMGLDKLSDITVLIPKDSRYKVILENINQLWQKELGVFFTLESLPAGEINKRVSAGDFDIAFINYTPKVNNVFSLMEEFASFDSAVAEYVSIANSNPSQAAEYISKGQQAVLESVYFVPMCKNTHSYIYRKYYQNVVINPFGNILNLKYVVAK